MESPWNQSYGTISLFRQPRPDLLPFALLSRQNCRRQQIFPKIVYLLC